MKLKYYGFKSSRVPVDISQFPLEENDLKVASDRLEDFPHLQHLLKHVKLYYVYYDMWIKNRYSKYHFFNEDSRFSLCGKVSTYTVGNLPFVETKIRKEFYSSKIFFIFWRLV